MSRLFAACAPLGTSGLAQEPDKLEGMAEKFDPNEFLGQLRRELADLPPLSEEEEYDLLYRARAGDVEAAQRVTTAYMERAAQLALSLAPAYRDPQATIGSAFHALMGLVHDPEVQYLSASLTQAIRDSLRRPPGARPVWIRRCKLCAETDLRNWYYSQRGLGENSEGWACHHCRSGAFVAIEGDWEDFYSEL